MEFESFLWNRFRRNKQILKGSFTLVLSLIILKTVIFRSHCIVLFQPLLNTDRHSDSVRKAYLYNKLSLWRQILLDLPCPTTSVEHLRSVHWKTSNKRSFNNNIFFRVQIYTHKQQKRWFAVINTALICGDDSHNIYHEITKRSCDRVYH